ncbi:MAG TPA: TRAP transporter small permease [Alphaproteobacteria bacterium]|nr:TRAP transporter small permease [Alphaproteobacteria bacterium]
MQRLLDGLSNLFAAIGAVGLVLMMLHITADVIGKYVFNAPVPVTLEVVSNYYMVAVVFLPLALVERNNGHIFVELVSQHLRPRLQMLLAALTSLVAAAYFGAFTYRTWLDAIAKYRIGEYIQGTVELSNWPSRFMLPLGCGLIVLVLLVKAWRLLRGEAQVLEKPAELIAEE